MSRKNSRRPKIGRFQTLSREKEHRGQMPDVDRVMSRQYIMTRRLILNYIK